MASVCFNRGELRRLRLDDREFALRLRPLRAALTHSTPSTVTVEFGDTSRPDLWCHEGLLRATGHSAGCYTFDAIVACPVHRISAALPTFVGEFRVPGGIPAADSAFIAKVNEIIAGDPLGVTLEMNGATTIVVTSRTARIGSWAFLTLLCNYYDRGAVARRVAATLPRQALRRPWAPIHVSQEVARGFLGNMPSSSFGDTLRQLHYGLATQPLGWDVEPPVYRLAVVHPCDVIDDYAAHSNYRDVVARELDIPRPHRPLWRARLLGETFSRLLRNNGAFEVAVPVLGAFSDLERLGVDQRTIVRLENADSTTTDAIADSALPPILDYAAHSVAYAQTVTLFTVAPVAARAAPNALSVRTVLGALLTGTDDGFNTAHALVHTLLDSIGLEPAYVGTPHRALERTRSFAAVVGERVVAVFGDVRPDVLSHWRIRDATYLEIDLDALGISTSSSDAPS